MINIAWSDPKFFIPDDPGGSENLVREISDFTQTESLVGRIIANRYKITELLGQGGMALVYKAQMADGRPVAIKTLKYRQADLETRFALEISIHSKLKHPNIVEPIEVLKDHESGLNLFVMEYLEGLNLEDLLVSYKRLNSVNDISTVLSQILDALEFAHFNGYIHRDLKPENIIITKQDGRHLIKILDFGLAKIEEDLQKITKTGVVLGSPLYMSPEQCMGESIDARTDLYSFGILAYELITGSPPYLSDDPMELMKSHCSQLISPPSMETYRDDLNGINYLNTIVQKLLRTEKNNLHNDIYELKEELSAWWKHATKSDGEVETPFRVFTEKNKAKQLERKEAKEIEDKNALEALVKNKLDSEKKNLKEKTEVASKQRFSRKKNIPVKTILITLLVLGILVLFGFFVVTLSERKPNFQSASDKKLESELVKGREVKDNAKQTVESGPLKEKEQLREDAQEDLVEPEPQPKRNRRIVAPPGVYRGR